MTMDKDSERARALLQRQAAAILFCEGVPDEELLPGGAKQIVEYAFGLQSIVRDMADYLGEILEVHIYEPGKVPKDAAPVEMIAKARKALSHGRLPEARKGLSDALRVMVQTPGILAHIAATDPKALHQARTALEKYGVR